ncbi:MAG: aminotransferase class I/II-fold pyridoxal phosphate-dependent enzyme, partial [Pseudomonadota bacterium]
VYARFVYDRDAAPSFYDVIEPDDRLIFVNTFSKNWAMTGWRVGWISAPPELGQVFENLVQYNTSGVAAFLQRGAVAALAEGEDFFQMQLDRARKGRDILSDALSRSGRASFAKPDGTFYLFFHIDGEDDATDLAYRLVDEAGVGFAPGATFGDVGRPFLRACFMRDLDQVTEGAERIAEWLSR